MTITPGLGVVRDPSSIFDYAQYYGLISIKSPQFGAKNDGSDASTAINNAAQYAYQNGMALFIPPGTFTIDHPIVLSGMSYLTIMGAGPSSKIKLGYAGDAFQLQSGGHNVFRDFAVDGNGQSSGHLFNNTGQMYNKFINIHLYNIVNGYDGFHMDGASGQLFDLMFRDCYVDSNTGRSAYYFGSVSDNYLYGGVVNGESFGLQYSIYMKAASSVTFNGGHYYNNGVNVLYIEDGYGLYKFLGTVLDNANSDIAHIFSTSANGLTHVEFDDVTFQAIQPGKAGLRIEGNVSQTKVINPLIVPDDSGTKSGQYGIVEVANGSYTPSTTIIRNPRVHDVPKLMKPIYQLIGAGSYVTEADMYNPLQVVESTINTAGSDVYLAQTTKPNQTRLFRVEAYVTVKNAATNVKVMIYYSHNGGQTKYFVNNASLAVGEYNYQSFIVPCDTLGTVSLVANVGTAGNVIVSGNIVPLE